MNDGWEPDIICNAFAAQTNGERAAADLLTTPIICALRVVVDPHRNFQTDEDVFKQ
jgi:hypothetical protein